MNKKRILAGVLVLAMMMTAFSACSKKETAKEVMEKSIDKSMEIKTSKQNFKMDMSYDMGLSEEEMAEDQMTSGLIEMIDSMNISGEFASDVESGLLAGNMLLDMKGLQFNLEIYASNAGNIVVKMPMSDKYITVNSMTEVSSEEEIEEMKIFSKQIAASLMASFSEENMVMEDKSVELLDGTYDLKEITVTLDDSEVKALIKKLIPEVYANKTMRKSMEGNLKLQLEMEGKIVEDMDMDAEIDKMIEEAIAAFDEAEEALTIDEFIMVFGIDEDYNTRQTNMKMTYSVADETTEKTISMGFDLTSEMYEIDEPVSIDMPEINEENSITLEDFIMETMFGGMPQMEPMPEAGAIQE